MDVLIEGIEILFYVELKEKFKINKRDLEFNLPLDLTQMEETKIDNKVDLEFYLITNGLNGKWDFNLEQNLCGRLNISELAHIINDQSDFLNYAPGEDDPRLEHFRPVDYFVEEACCGVLMDGSGDNCMYYHDYGESTIHSLDLDFKGYLEIGLDARYFLYWQRYIVELVNGPQDVEVLFKTGMKEVFPEFDLEVFTKKFESLRLSNN